MADVSGLDPAFRANVEALIRASGGKVTLVSAFRSHEHQQRLWDAAVKKYGSAAKARKWVAQPGHSHHEGGHAVDFGGDLSFVRANAARFNIYQPMPWEAWHYEPVGSGGSTTTPSSSRRAYTTPPDSFKPGGENTVEGQLGNLAQILMAGATDPMAVL